MASGEAMMTISKKRLADMNDEQALGVIYYGSISGLNIYIACGSSTILFRL